MKRIILLAGVLCALACKAQQGGFPNTDSLRKANDIWVTNDAITAFRNLRLNILLHGIIDFLDSAAGPGSAYVDNIYAVNDSVGRFSKPGVTVDFPIKGVYDSRRKVDSAFALNDTVIRLKINGTNRDVVVRGPDIHKINDTLLYVKGDTVKVGGTGGSGTTEILDPLSLKRSASPKLFTRTPVASKLSDLRSIASGDLDTGFIYQTIINGRTRKYRYDPNDNSSLDDSAYTIIANGKRLHQIFDGVVTPEDFGAKGDGVTDDWWPFQKMINYLAATGGQVNLDGTRTYYIDSTKSINLNGLVGFREFTFKGNGAIIKGKNIFLKRPSDQTDAENHQDVIIRFNGVHFESPSHRGKAIELGAVVNSTVENCQFLYFDTAYIFKFGLWSRSSHNNITACGMGPVFTIGDWSGATNANSQSNASWSKQDVVTTNFAMFPKSTGFYVRGSSEVVIDDITVEGSVGWAGIFDSDLSTVVHDFTLRGLHSEMNVVDSGIVYIRAAGGTIQLDRIFDQSPGVKPTVFVDNPAAQNPDIEISRIGNLPIFKAASNSNQTMWQFKGMSSGWNYTTHFLSGGSYVAPLYVLNLTADGTVQGENLKLKSKTALDLTSDLNTIRFYGNGVFQNGTGLYPQVNDMLPIGNDVLRWKDLYVKDIYSAWGHFDTLTYNGHRTLAEISDTGMVSKEMLGYLTPPETSIFHDTTLRGTNTFSDPIGVNQDFLQTFSDSAITARGKIDSASRTPGVDSIYFWADGRPIAVLKDSIGPGSGGNDDWGAQTAVTDNNTTKGNGTVSLPIRSDTGVMATRNWVNNLVAGIPGYVAPDGSETKLISGTNYSVTGTGTISDPYKLTIVGSPSANPLRAVSLYDYGFQGNAVVGAGNYATGTNNTPFLQNAITAVEDNQLIVVPPGGLFSTPLDTIRGTKTVNVLFLGTHYQAGNKLFIIKHQSGAFRQHHIVHSGTGVDRINLPGHNKTNHDAGTQPNWGAMTGEFVTVVNTSQVVVETNKMTGFRAVVEQISGYGSGSQENRYTGRCWRDCAYGAIQTSIDGNSYSDKTWWIVDRFSGGLGIFVDGFSGSVGDGPYNGAARSNHYIMLLELVDSGVVVQADATDNEYKVTMEGGTSTGVLGNTGWRMRSTGANYVRNATYNGGGVFKHSWLTEGMGLFGSGSVPVWNGGYKYGDRFKVLANGELNMISDYPVATYVQSAAPSNFHFTIEDSYDRDVTVGSTPYTVQSYDRNVFMSVSNGVINFPAANVNVGRYVTVWNMHGSTNLTVANVQALKPEASALKPLTAQEYYCNGTAWYSINNGDGESSGGGLNYQPLVKTPDSTNTSLNAVRLKVGSYVNPTAKVDIDGSIPATPGSGGLKVRPGVLNSGEAFLFQTNALGQPMFTDAALTTKKFLMEPVSGNANEILVRNSTNTDNIYTPQKSELLFTQTTSVTLGASTTSPTTLINTAQTLSSVPNVGDQVVLDGTGNYTIGSGSTYFALSFIVGGVQVVGNLNLGVLSAGSGNYTYHVTVTRTGTANYLYAAQMELMASSFAVLKRVSQGTGTGISWTGSVDVQGNFNSNISGSSLVAFTNNIEIKRK